VTLFEAANRVGGHSCTVDVNRQGGAVPVDMGFIVYNEPTYPNLTAFFHHLQVPTQASDMSLGVSLDDGALEYGGNNIATMFAQTRNLVRPRFWRMLAEILRLYRMAPGAVPDDSVTLGAWLDQHKFSAGFQRDHLLPMAAAIWSCPAGAVRDQPAAAFIRFCDNHGLLRLTERPVWRTVTGGSREYIRRLLGDFSGQVATGREVVQVQRGADGVTVRDAHGGAEQFDHVVLATHGDEACALLADKDAAEQAVLGAFRCQPNRAVLHSDPALMPRRRAVWSSWNFLARTTADAGPDAEPPQVTYWMNRLQSLPGPDLFVTLNPVREPAPGLVHRTQNFAHPVFDLPALAAQKQIWALQGSRRTWFCGAYLGAGFHEDGIQAGLAVAEQLGGVRRPWQVAGESARLYRPQAALAAA
jgi:predicted NAD/FAD-binding protein